MSIDAVKDLLFDYARGILTDEQNAFVEKHLAQSQELREAMMRVKAYYASIDSLDPAAVPETFLDNLHKRIESPSKKNVLQKILAPLYVRIPFELAGVAATIMLVVYFFLPEFSHKRLMQHTAVTETVSQDERVEQLKSEQPASAAESSHVYQHARYEVVKQGSTEKKIVKKEEMKELPVQNKTETSSEALHQKTAKHSESGISKPERKSAVVSPQPVKSTAPVANAPLAPSSAPPVLSENVTGTDQHATTIEMERHLDAEKSPAQEFQKPNTKASYQNLQSLAKAKKSAQGMSIPVFELIPRELKAQRHGRTHNAAVSSLDSYAETSEALLGSKKEATEVTEYDNSGTSSLRAAFEKFNVRWLISDSSSMSVSYVATIPKAQFDLFIDELRAMDEFVIAGEYSDSLIQPTDSIKAVFKVFHKF